MSTRNVKVTLRNDEFHELAASGIFRVASLVQEAIDSTDSDERQGLGMEAQGLSRVVGSLLHQLPASSEVQDLKQQLHPSIKKLITEIFQLP